MPIPDFQTVMLPLLRFASDGEEHALVDARECLGGEFRLTAEETSQLLPSGRQAVWANRVAWAKSYLDQSGLVESTKRGHFRVTPRGREVLENPPERITIKYLEKFPEFVEFRGTRRKSAVSLGGESRADEVETPEETLDDAYQKMRSGLAAELLSRVKSASPQFFERLVVELLIKMGYGGSRIEAGEAIGKAGDEGIDGVISEDRLGLDVVYIQAKRWENTVGRPDVQRFVGALNGKRARKGVFITTSAFSSEAHSYVATIDPRVVLIDGRQLAEYMIDFGVGVTTKAVYEVKRVDSDYFVEE
ncbi:MAG TPA: restriction endonuclease [Thermoanaerobaculia bacterium]